MLKVRVPEAGVFTVWVGVDGAEIDQPDLGGVFLMLVEFEIIVGYGAFGGLVIDFDEGMDVQDVSTNRTPQGLHVLHRIMTDSTAAKLPLFLLVHDYPSEGCDCHFATAP